MKLRSLSCAVVALSGCAGDDGGGGEVVHAERPAFVQIGGDAPYRLISLGLDSTTYEEMLGDRDSRPGLSDLGPSSSGERRVMLKVDSAAPALLYEALLGPEPATTSPIALLTPSLAVLLGGGDDEEAVALLVPAVQRATAASIEGDGTFVIELAGAGDIGPIDEPQAAGGVQVAVGDVNGIVGGNAEGAPLGASMRLSLVSPASFVRGTGGLTSDTVDLVRPYAADPTWLDPSRPTWATIDVRDESGAIVHRMRIDPAMAHVSGASTLTLAPAKAAYLKINDIKGESRDGAAEAAMMEASYASYNGRSYTLAIDALTRFTELDPTGGTPAIEDVQTYWLDRAQIVGQLHAAVAHAAEHRALLCQVALPSTLAAAKTIADTTSPDLDPANALAATYEALRVVPAPVAGAHVGPLELAALAGAPTPPSVAVACQALDEIGALRDAVAATLASPDLALDLVGRAAFIEGSPLDLDHAIAAWVKVIDGVTGGTLTDPEALAAARAKADILIEALGEHASASEQRWMLAQELVAP